MAASFPARLRLSSILEYGTLGIILPRGPCFKNWRPDFGQIRLRPIELTGGIALPVRAVSVEAAGGASGGRGAGRTDDGVGSGDGDVIGRVSHVSE